MEIWLPPKARPRFRCLVCDKPFYDGEQSAFERHVSKCAEENREKLDAERLESKVPEVFDRGPERSDVELIRWVGDNRDAILEGRKRVN